MSVLITQHNTAAMSSFNDIFEQLLSEKSVMLSVVGAEAESLRVSLSRRWNGYKQKMDSLGFLDDTLKDLVLGKQCVEANDTLFTVFTLRQRKHRKQYSIVVPAPAGSDTNEADTSGK